MPIDFTRLIDWFAGGERQYMTLTHCMQHDSAWIALTVDTLAGDAGTDLLFGHEGSEVLIGGTGSDVFVFDTAPVAGKVKDIDRIVAEAEEPPGGLTFEGT